MIVGFIVTAATAGRFLDPFTTTRLVAVTAVVCACAFVLAVAAVWRVEGDASIADDQTQERAPPQFRAALAQVWREPEARRFTIFVFVSMLAYSMQDLILEPFAGTVFGLTPGETTQLSGVQNGGVLAGMILVAVAGTAFGRTRGIGLRAWTVGGCLASACALIGLAAGAWSGADWPLRAWVFALGAANGAFAVAAIGSMMALASSGSESREGVRMGLWGAAQAIAFGAGGFAGTIAADAARHLLGSPVAAYASVFAAEALLFVYAAWLALRIDAARRPGKFMGLPRAAEPFAADLGRR
jgi:BCD family chlorophyll transporter-like MFS transporter